MPCDIKKDGSGQVTMIKCSRGTRGQSRICPFCGENPVAKLCDFPVQRGVGRSQTCDAEMCFKCATEVAKNTDVCPNHKGKPMR